MQKIISLVAVVGLTIFLAGCSYQAPAEEQITEQPTVQQNETQPTAVVENNQKIEQPVEQIGVTIFRGSQFDIEYPQNFTAKPIAPTTVYNGENYVQTDEAYFTSPDGTVEFFVYSPLWSGDPKTYLTIPQTEQLVSEKTEKINEDEQPGQFGDKIVHWATVKAKDGSYHRSFVSIKEQVGTGSDLHHVFGIKYKNSASYEKYREQYVTFKESLQQYAD